MNTIRGPIVIVVVLAASFVWGYKKDLFSAAPVTSAPPPAASEPPPVPPIEDQPVVANQALQPSVNQIRKPAAAPFATAFTFPNGEAVAPLVAATGLPPGVAPEQYTQPQNPYADLSKKMKDRQASMADTFDSIRREKIDESQAIQKNAYFKKLSEQLKELQGQPPPEAAAPGALPIEAPPLPGAGGNVPIGSGAGLPQSPPVFQPPPAMTGGAIEELLPPNPGEIEAPPDDDAGMDDLEDQMPDPDELE